MKNKENRYLPNFEEKMRLLMAERPMVLWHWRHKPYENLKIAKKESNA